MGYGKVTRRLNSNTERRLRKAYERILQLRKEKKEIGSVILPTGCGGAESQRTMAQLMERHLLQLLEEEDISLTVQIRFIVNSHEPWIWGTVREMQWAYEQARGIDPHLQLEFVTNARHGRRVRFTNKLLIKAQECSVIASDDPLSTLYHEVLGYGKLVLYATGVVWLIDRVENLRRRYYSGG